MKALRTWLRRGHGWQGLQLAAAVALAFAVSWALRLPQGFWAVMSALIVMRANPDATLGAGRERVLGTLAGAACGLAATLAFGPRVSAPGASLAIVGAVAFLTAARPALRAAPLTALIVLGAGGGDSGVAWHAALLRCAEIAVGVAAGLAVAHGAQRLGIAARPAAACGALLRQLDSQLALPHDASAAQRQQAALSVRETARRLGALLQGVREERQSQLLQLALRVVQDVALLARLRGAQCSGAGDAPVVDAARLALERCARSLEGREDADAPAALRALSAAAPEGWRVDAVALLREDLHLLLRVAAAPRASL